MALWVSEVMNREVFSLRPNEPCRHAFDYLVELGISGAPVVDESRPIGFASLRDLARAGEHERVCDRMTVPPIVIRDTSSIAQAMRQMVDADLHHAPVVGPGGEAVGFLSLLDLARATLGVPARHPATFPHYDAAVGVTWSDDAPLALEHADLAPATAGLLAIVHGGIGRPEQVVWAEAADHLQRRICELAAGGGVPPGLDGARERRELRFRCAEVVDPEARGRALAATRARVAHQTGRAPR